MSIYRKQKGNKGEQAVVEYILKKGYTIVARNYRTPSGEIDIIGKKNSVIAFIEVKWRASNAIDPTTAINWSKQRKIISTARHFISTHNYNDIHYRFDVGIISKDTDTETLSYIPNAFEWNE